MYRQHFKVASHWSLQLLRCSAQKQYGAPEFLHLASDVIEIFEHLRLFKFCAADVPAVFQGRLSQELVAFGMFDPKSSMCSCLDDDVLYFSELPKGLQS